MFFKKLNKFILLGIVSATSLSNVHASQSQQDNCDVLKMNDEK